MKRFIWIALMSGTIAALTLPGRGTAASPVLACEPDPCHTGTDCSIECARCDVILPPGECEWP
jgi:hypothetical protein